jgi:hypothetical protein
MFAECELNTILLLFVLYPGHDFLLLTFFSFTPICCKGTVSSAMVGFQTRRGPGGGVCINPIHGGDRSHVDCSSRLQNEDFFLYFGFFNKIQEKIQPFFKI